MNRAMITQQSFQNGMCMRLQESTQNTISSCKCPHLPVFVLDVIFRPGMHPCNYGWDPGRILHGHQRADLEHFGIRDPRTAIPVISFLLCFF